MNIDITPVKLVPEMLTRSTTLKHACLLVMCEKDGTRHLPFVINENDFNRLQRAFANDDTHQVDIAAKLADAFNITLSNVSIVYDEQGKPKTVCHFVHDDPCLIGAPRNRSVEMGIADGIITAMGMKADILMSATLFNSLYERNPQEGRVAIPMHAMTDELLEEALQQAVKEENYELASKLRDELQNRHSSTMPS